MIHIVPYLLSLIKLLNKILFKFQCFLVNRYMNNDPSDRPVSEKYRALKMDAMPVIEQRSLLDYQHLLDDYLNQHGKPLKPVKFLPPPDTVCPICGDTYTTEEEITNTQVLIF